MAKVLAVFILLAIVIVIVALITWRFVSDKNIIYKEIKRGGSEILLDFELQKMKEQYLVFSKDAELKGDERTAIIYRRMANDIQNERNLQKNG